MMERDPKKVKALSLNLRKYNGARFVLSCFFFFSIGNHLCRDYLGILDNEPDFRIAIVENGIERENKKHA